MRSILRLDYEIVLEVATDLILNSGERQTTQPGDVAVQRGTMYVWKNPSSKE